MRWHSLCAALAACALAWPATAQESGAAKDTLEGVVDPPLGLPALTIPEDNPQTTEKVALGDRLFHDTRFSSTGTISCATCHDRAKGFGDGPLKTSRGIDDLTGTRNAPTVINAAYFGSLFWDGRSPTLENQSLHPFLNPVEMGLQTHDPIVEIARTDPEYVRMFRAAFGVEPEDITIDEITKAIAAFERTLIAGNSPWDRWYFAGEEDAISESAKRGFDVFLDQGRCVSCHTVEQNFALFTDDRFHNIGVGVNRIQDDIPELAPQFLEAKAAGLDVDKAVLSDIRSSELGRFAISETLDDLGAFKTSTLRNIALTAPYMHDGSLATLKEVVEHYNNGGVTPADAPVNDHLSGGIRPLELTEQQIDDLVAFLEALTSPDFIPKLDQQPGGDSGDASTAATPTCDTSGIVAKMQRDAAARDALAATRDAGATGGKP